MRYTKNVIWHGLFSRGLVLILSFLAGNGIPAFDASSAIYLVIHFFIQLITQKYYRNREVETTLSNQIVKPLLNWDGLLVIILLLLTSKAFCSKCRLWISIWSQLRILSSPLPSSENYPFTMGCGMHASVKVRHSCHSCHSCHSLIDSGVCFILAGVLFYKLSSSVLKTPEQAYRCTLLFLYNPASIHFSALYSESVNTLLTFLVISCYYRVLLDPNSIQLSRRLMLVFVTIAVMARSNSVLLLLFYYPPVVLLQGIFVYLQEQQRLTAIRLIRLCLKYGVEGCLPLLPLVVYFIWHGNAFW